MFRTVIQAIAFSALTALPIFAQEMSQPSGNVVLTVSGNIDILNVGDTAQFDLRMLEALEQTTIETSTIWTEGTQVFQGVSLKVLVEELGIEGTTLRATAINDYAVDIPLTDAVDGGAIVAHRLNGDTMSVRDKGPLWIVYPFDSNADYRTEVVFSRSIWQLDRIEAID